MTHNLALVPKRPSRDHIETSVEKVKAKATVLYWAIFGLKQIGSVTESDMDGLEQQAEMIENDLESLASEIHG